MIKVKIAGTNKQEPQAGQSKGARKLRETKRMEELRMPRFQKRKKKKRHDVTSTFEFHEQMKILHRHQYTHVSREFYDSRDKKKKICKQLSFLRQERT